jgi:uncharacterized protein (TIGR03437 family)
MERSLRNTLTSLTVLLLGGALLAQAQTPTFSSSGVLNAASQVGGTVAPGMLTQINGSNLGTGNFFNCASVLPLSTNCNGVQVLVNGAAAPMVYESATSLSFQMPFNVSGNAQIQVSTTTGTSAPVTVPVAPTAPGLYSVTGTGSGTGYYYDITTSLFTVFSKPVQAGDTIELYGTGFGATNPVVAPGNRGPDPIAQSVAQATMTIANNPVTVTTAGLQPADSPANIAPGADEVVFTVPAGLAAGTYPVVVTVGGVKSNSVNLIVAPPPVTITSLSPSSPGVGPNQVVTVNGTGFQTGLSVTIAPPGSGSVVLSGSAIQSVTPTSFQLTVTFTVQGTYTMRVSNPDTGQSNVFIFSVGPTVILPVTVTNVENAASYLPNFESGSWVSIIGANLSSTTRQWAAADFVGLGNGLPMSLDGVSVTINGKSAAVYYISPTQINVQAPTDTAQGTVNVVVKNAIGTGNGSGTIQTYSPAFFPLTATGSAKVYAAAVHTDSTIAVPAGFYGPGVTTRAATPGETLLIYGTGFGPTNPTVAAGQLVPGASPLTDLTQLQLKIGGVTAQVTFAGITAVGEYQFNVVIPPLPDGDQAIVATIAGFPSQAGILIPIKN